jgi:DNA-binding XRE family transcriptional regulator
MEGGYSLISSRWISGLKKIQRSALCDIFGPLKITLALILFTWYSINMTGDDIRKWRMKNGYTQGQLAEVLGIAALTISRWERGDRDIPPYLHITLKCIPKRGGEIRKAGRPKGSTKKQERR